MGSSQVTTAGKVDDAENMKGAKTRNSRVLLTSTDRWSGPSRLAIALARAGFEVSGLYPATGHPLAKTSCLRARFRHDGFHPLQSLMEAIERCRPEMVVPCDDLAVEHLHELYAWAQGASRGEVADLIEKSLGDPQGYRIASARFDLLKIAAEEGILVPATRPIVAPADATSAGNELRFPLVLKADGTWGGRGVRIAQNSREAENAFRELAADSQGAGRWVKRLLLEQDRYWLRARWRHQQPVVTAQAHVSGRPANCAVVAWQGEVLAGIAVEVICARELTGPAMIVRVVDSPAMMTAAERIARRLGISGFFGLDFMIDDENEATYLIEMNPRGTQLCHLNLGPGKNMAGALWACLTGEPSKADPPVAENEVIAFYPQAQLAKSEFLATSHHDVPLEEPELMAELLHPWSGRTALGRLLDKMRPAAVRRKAPKPCVFEGAISARSVS
jgi:hypothetical protein